MTPGIVLPAPGQAYIEIGQARGAGAFGGQSRIAEVLHVAAEYRVTGMADAEDDGRIRKDPTDHRQGEKIQRVLVDQAHARRLRDGLARLCPVKIA